MSDQGPEIEDDSETGEFSRTDQFDRTASQRRRRRRKSHKEKSSAKIVPAIGVIVTCALLVGIGVLLGSSRHPTLNDDDQGKTTLENRLKRHKQWLTECTESGHSDWTCDHYDRTHFEAAAQLDHFSCENDVDANYRCRYALGTAEVVVLIPRTEKVNGEYQLSRRRPRTVILHSDINDPHHIGLSEGGRIQFRSKDPDKAMLVVNPDSGILHSLQTSGKANEE
ncbi:MAG: hypothetical protein ACI915_002669 [Gammaproteobacteria bacterium]|jgi:hypothetical protein